MIAVFAPGGLGVREAALTGALGEVMGVRRALVLAVAWRIWLVGLEISVALAALASAWGGRVMSRVRGPRST
jgi:uncharacterized membrane protein YbhN (UPF0104 family)